VPPARRRKRRQLQLPQPREVTIGERGIRHDPLHERPPDQPARFRLFDELDHRRTVHALDRDHLRAHVKMAQQHHGEPADPEERHGREGPCVGSDAMQVRDCPAVPHLRAVRVYDRLRFGGRTRRVDGHHRIGRRYLRLDLLEQFIADVGVVVEVFVDPDPPEIRQFRKEEVRLRPRNELRPPGGDQCVHVGVADRPARFGFPVERAQRHSDGTDPRDREHRDDERGTLR